MPSLPKRLGASTHLTYGLDAPGPQWFLLFTSLLTGLSGFLALKFGAEWHLTGFLGLLAFFLAALWVWMVWSAFKGKILAVENFIKGLELKGGEKLLDVGCGRGFILIEAAKKLPRGRATGLDDWSQFDIYANNPGKTWENAGLEGVSDRVKVDTADMRKLPYASNAFDRVTAHLSLHRLKNRADRKRALAEMKRVLKPKGMLALQDFKYLRQTREDLKALRFKNIKVSKYKLFFFPPVKRVIAYK